MNVVRWKYALKNKKSLGKKSPYMSLAFHLVQFNMQIHAKFKVLQIINKKHTQGKNAINTQYSSKRN